LSSFSRNINFELTLFPVFLFKEVKKRIYLNAISECCRVFLALFLTYRGESGMIIGELPLIGVVGKPNSGKTTFWNSATGGNAKTSPIPFTTIEPNEGVAFVTRPCIEKEFNVTCNPRSGLCIEGIRHIPIKLLDVAGLVPDAWKGRGLGNQFLDHLRQAEVLLHIIDASGRFDADGNDLGRVGAWDPIKDVKFLENEISRWLWQIIKRDWERLSRRVEAEKRDLVEVLATRLSGLAVTEEHIKKAIELTDLNPEKPTSWSDDDLLRFAINLRKVRMPIVIVANKVDIPKARENVDRMREAGIECIPASALAELILIKLTEKGAIKYIRGSNSFEVLNPNLLSSKEKKALEMIEEILDIYGSTGVQKAINTAVFDVAKMIVVYPVADEKNLTDKQGRVLPDAILVRQGTTLEEFAGMIHSDFAKTLLYGIDARTKRKLSKNYVLKDNDVIRLVVAAR